MQSKLFKLSTRDFFDGLVAAIVVSVLVTLGSIVSNSFSIFTADWVEIGKNILDAAFYGFMAYMGKAFLTDNENKVLGKI